MPSYYHQVFELQTLLGGNLNEKLLNSQCIYTRLVPAEESIFRSSRNSHFIEHFLLLILLPTPELPVPRPKK